jgi:hypothetical protein
LPERIALNRHLERCKLASNTVTAYTHRRRTYVAWSAEHGSEHPDAFTDLVVAEASV